MITEKEIIELLYKNNAYLGGFVDDLENQIIDITYHAKDPEIDITEFVKKAFIAIQGIKQTYLYNTEDFDELLNNKKQTKPKKGE